jgi:hypothetical protein
MRAYSFALAAFFTLAMAFPSRAAEKPRPAQANQNSLKKVWSNDDLDELRSRGLISIVGQEATEAVAPPAPASTESTHPAYNSRLEDPAWYAQKAADLQAELEKREATLREQQTAMALAAEGITQPGIALDKPNAGVTLQAGLAILSAQVQEVQNQMDELGDLARQNNIPPGVLRS